MDLPIIVVASDLEQIDVAANIGVSLVSVSNWERGVNSPSRRMPKRIREFLDRTSKPIPTVPINGLYCKTCGISSISLERCLFEKICKSFAESKL
jgi:transcriptional regulator with XRE-family HTH domain